MGGGEKTDRDGKLDGEERYKTRYTRRRMLTEFSRIRAAVLFVRLFSYIVGRATYARDRFSRDITPTAPSAARVPRARTDNSRVQRRQFPVRSMRRNGDGSTIDRRALPFSL